jgi:hypothetical protein
MFFFGRGFHYRPSSAARPPKNHGPASRRPRPSAESAPFFFMIYICPPTPPPQCCTECCTGASGPDRGPFASRRGSRLHRLGNHFRRAQEKEPSCRHPRRSRGRRRSRKSYYEAVLGRGRKAIRSAFIFFLLRAATPPCQNELARNFSSVAASPRPLKPEKKRAGAGAFPPLHPPLGRSSLASLGSRGCAADRGFAPSLRPAARHCNEMVLCGV